MFIYLFELKIKLSAKLKFALFEMSLFCSSSEENKNKLNYEQKVSATTAYPSPSFFSALSTACKTLAPGTWWCHIVHDYIIIKRGRM